MKKILLLMLSFLMAGICNAEDITICYKGTTAKVKQHVKDSVLVATQGACVSIESQFKDHKLTIRLTGKSDNGQLILRTVGKAQINLDGLTLTCQEGAPIWLKNKKKVEIVALEGTNNTLTITACADTANHKAATVWAKDKIQFSGSGTLNVVATGDGCRGIKSKKDITIEGLTLNVKTTGNHLGEKPMTFGDMPDFGDNFPPPFGNDSTFAAGPPPFNGNFPPFGNDSTQFPAPPSFDGQFPPFGNMFPEGNDSTMQGPPGGFGGKHKYVASAKGIASKGKIIINSGNLTVSTSTAGAEGIEGKEGIIFNGGQVNVLATDDAINANGTIEFNGAHVTVQSTGNDAVDANPKDGFFTPFGDNSNQASEPVIIIRGGTVYAWSRVGSPEEGLDCDFAPLAIEGGHVFTIGGGMGEMPSVPTNATAKQPTLLLIGLNVIEGEAISLYDESHKLIDSITVPFSLQRSASIVSTPALQIGKNYTIKAKGYEKTFTISEPFTIVR